MPAPDGKLVHAEIAIGNSIIMLSDEFPGMSCQRPRPRWAARPARSCSTCRTSTRPSSGRWTAGCTSIMAPTDMFWGDRFGKLEDPYGHQWGLATHKEDVLARGDGRAAPRRRWPRWRRAEKRYARHPRLRHHRRRQEALHGGQLEPRARDAARLRPGAHHRALAGRQAGAADPEGQRGDGADASASPTARTPAWSSASSSWARTST